MPFRNNSQVETWMNPGVSAGVCRGGQLLLLCFLALFGTVEHAYGQRSDGFEGGEPRWLLVESDCNAELSEHELTLIMPHRGRTSELFELACGNGSLALLAYPIEPCAVIDEFQPSVWTRCRSGRLQLGVRVIYPRAEHPVTNGRLNSLVWGDAYDTPGRWQQLTVRDLAKKLQQEIIGIRQRFGPELDLTGAFIDSIVLNAYVGPGRYRVQVDDLATQGIVPLASLGIETPNDWRQRWRWQYETPTKSERFWAAPNRPLSWMQYRSESLPWMASMGFSGLVLDQVPSQADLKSIKDSGLAVISPPPTSPLVFDDDLKSTIRGWMIGSGLDGQSLHVADAQIARAAKMPIDLQRPLIGEALERYWYFSRQADEVIVPFPSVESAGTTREKLDWLREQLKVTSKRGNGWVSIAVDGNPAVSQQYWQAKKTVEGYGIDQEQTLEELRMELALGVQQASGEEPNLASPNLIRHQAVTSLLAGARGLLFRTLGPMNRQKDGGGEIAAALRWINQDLKLWGPWLVAGQSMPRPQLNRSDYESRAWLVDRSQLVIAQILPSKSQQFVPPSHQGGALQFTCPLSSSGLRQVLRLTHNSIERMPVEMTPGGIRWQVENPEPIESFVITSDQLVMQFLRKRVGEAAVQNASDQLEILSYRVQAAAEVIDARFPPENTPEAEQIRRANFDRVTSINRQIERAWSSLRSQQAQAASRAGYIAGNELNAVLDEAHRAALVNLAAPQTSPFVLHPRALPYHWRTAQACDQSTWRVLPFPASEMASLESMLSAGWTLQRRPDTEASVRVELLPPQTASGGALRLAAFRAPAAVQPLSGGYAGATQRVRSPGVSVLAGQFVRISATARVLNRTTDPASGLLVYENQGGPGLGQLIRGTAGEEVKVELYRFIPNDGELRVLAECRGECDVILQNLNLSVIQPATTRRTYVTVPKLP